MTTTNPLTVTAEPGVPIIDMVRELDAPIADVFRAYTEPDLVKQWLGPRGYEIDMKEYDARAGGSWAYVHRDPDGNSYGFHGVFHSVAPDRLVQTFEFEGAPGHVSLDAASFEDAGAGRTRVRIRSVFQSVEARDAMVASGMERGLSQGFERLDELLRSSRS